MKRFGPFLPRTSLPIAINFINIPHIVDFFAFLQHETLGVTQSNDCEGNLLYAY